MKISQPVAEIRDRPGANDLSQLLAARARLQAIEPDAGHSRERGELRERKRTQVVGLVAGAPLPGDADFEPRLRPQLSFPLVDQGFVGPKIGDVGRNRLKRSSKYSRQAQQRHVAIELRQGFSAGITRSTPGQLANSRASGALHSTSTVPPCCLTRGA